MAFGPIAHFILSQTLYWTSLYHYTVKYHQTFHSPNTQINHWRTSISMHRHFFSLSLATMLSIFFKFRTDSRKYGSIHITSVQLYKIRCTLPEFPKSVDFWLLWTCCWKFNWSDLQLFDQKQVFLWRGNAYVSTKLCNKVKRVFSQRHSQ